MVLSLHLFFTLKNAMPRLSKKRNTALQPVLCMERVKGIEPSSSAWKAEVLPLNYTRMCCDMYNIIAVIFTRINIFFKNPNGFCR